jgi:hypothetical protein
MGDRRSELGAESTEERLLFQYLLGNLSEEEQVRVEDRAFADADYLSALEAAEEDLIDAYVRDELAPPQVAEFERLFLTSPQRRNKIDFARALATVTAESTRAASPGIIPQESAWRALAGLFRAFSPAAQWAGAVAALVCGLGVAWLVVHTVVMQSRVEILEAQNREQRIREESLQRQIDGEQTRAAGLAAELDKRQSLLPAPPIASLILLPGLARGANRVERLVIAPESQMARIEIQLEPRDDYPRFRAELHLRSGAEVLVRGNLPKRESSAGSSVSFEVPASALPAGDYELTLQGVRTGQTPESIGYYYFSVRKR